MPLILGPLGCDEALWSKVIDKRALLRLARLDEQRCRRKVDKLRELVAQQEVAEEKEVETADFIASVESEMASDYEQETRATTALAPPPAPPPRTMAPPSPSRRSRYFELGLEQGTAQSPPPAMARTAAAAAMATTSAAKTVAATTAISKPQTRAATRNSKEGAVPSAPAPATQKRSAVAEAGERKPAKATTRRMAPPPSPMAAKSAAPLQPAKEQKEARPAPAAGRPPSAAPPPLATSPPEVAPPPPAPAPATAPKRRLVARRLVDRGDDREYPFVTPADTVAAPLSGEARLSRRERRRREVDGRIAALSKEAVAMDARAQAAKVAWLRSQGEIAITQRTLKQLALVGYLDAAASPASPATPDAPVTPATPTAAAAAVADPAAAAVDVDASPRDVPAAVLSPPLDGPLQLRERRAGGAQRSDGEAEPGALAADAPSSALTPTVAEALATLGLMDPTTMPVEEQDKVVGAVLTGAAVLFPLFYLKFGLLPDLVFSAVFGGGPAGLLALRTDAVGKFARDAVGGTTNLALSNFVIRAEEIDKEYQVTRDAQQRLRRQIDQLSELRDKVDARKRRDGE